MPDVIASSAVSGGSRSGSADWSISKAAFYQIVPGVANLLVFIPAVLLLRDTGIPSMAALFLAILIGEVPAYWYLMRKVLREEGKAFTISELFPWREKLGVLKLVGIGLFLTLVSMVIVFGLSSALEPGIRAAFFGWVPDWFVMEGGPAGMSGASRTGLLVVWALSGLVGVGIGGWTQELYHRGFVLPRTAHLGWIAVPLNALFFALVHLVAPWGWPFFFLAALLWGAAVYRYRSVQIGLAGHIGMLALGWLMMTAFAFGFIAPPG